VAKNNNQKKAGTGEFGASGMCNRYGPDVYMSYLNGSMPQGDLISFEKHCKTCSVCRSAVRKAHEQLLVEIDAQHEKTLLETAFKKIDEKFGYAHAGLIDIVVSILGKTLELIRSTAEALLPEPVMAIRGAAPDALHPHTLRLVQAIEDPPLSIQVRLVRIHDGPEIDLAMTVFDNRLDDFITDYSADIRGPAGTFHQKSSETGELQCCLENPGVYTLCIKCNGKRVCDVRIEAR